MVVVMARLFILFIVIVVEAIGTIMSFGPIMMSIGCVYCRGMAVSCIGSVLFPG